MNNTPDNTARAAREIIPQLTKSLVPYAQNSRTHSPDQVRQIAASITEFGFTNPVLVDSDNNIVAGHGRVLAAASLGLAEVPTISVGWLSDDQRRAYVIADNQIALNAGWDAAILRSELSLLNEARFNTELLGFDPSALDAIMAGLDPDSVLDDEPEANPYTRKIEAPIYTPIAPAPNLSELYTTIKTDALKAEIDARDLSPELRAFLLAAADRHTVFNFKKIADFYAASDPEIRSLMQRSALVIIDFDAAIENGFVRLSEQILDQYRSDYGDA
jgi:ParB-like chromosome segregation protein Spo0J